MKGGNNYGYVRSVFNNSNCFISDIIDTVNRSNRKEGIMNKAFASLAVAILLATNGGLTMEYNAGNQFQEACYNHHLILDHENCFRGITDEEYLLICKCVQTEARGESNECQEAVATVILNRWLNPDKYPDTIAEVIYQPNQFAIDESISRPDVGVRVAVHNAIVYYNTYQMCIPYQTYYFRADHYFENLGKPYMVIDNTYFSVDENAIVD